LAKTPPAITDYQYSAALERDASVKDPGKAPGKGADKAFDLKRFDPAARPFSSGDRATDKAAMQELADELDRLQDLFYADRRFKLLVVLQGTDTSGKDGTIRGVFGEMSALGVRTVAWKAPTEAERAHDFLWRIHAMVPGAGEVTLFNRSHYEDVLVPLVNGSITPEETGRRYAHINDFERLLSDNGTVVLKFLLHISKDEQRARLQDRVDTPEKNWKFAPEDLSARQHWEAYQAAYSAAVAATGTPWAPWTIVPADSKTHRNLMIANTVVRAMKDLKLRYPPPNPKLVGLRVE
jgi:PPK2 family polyphosphate:nucleotide phosphotransferase